MAEKRYIDVEARESGLDDLNRGLERVEDNLRDVDTAGEQASKSVDDVAGNGGAIAILDSLTGGLATRLRDAYEASKLFNISLKGMRTALIATGIGAFVVAIGLVVAYWDEIEDFVKGTTRELQKQIKELDRKAGRLSFELELLGKQEENLKIQGKSTEEIKKQRVGILLTLIETNKQLLENLKTELEAEKASARRLTILERILRGAGGRPVGTVGKITEEEEERIKSIQDRIQETTLSIEDARNQLAQILNPEEEEEKKEQKKREREKKARLVIKENNKLILDAEKQLTADLDIEATHREEIMIARRKKGAEAMIKISEMERDQRLMVLGQVADGIMAFANLVGQQTAAGKALAIAGATINTFLGITEVWSTKSTLPEPLATISRIANTLVVAASGFSAVRSISQVQIPNTNITRPGGLPSGGGGGGAAPAIQQPDFNIIGQSGFNQLAETIREREEKPVRAYIVDDDIKTSRELDRRISDTASIG